MQATTPDNFMTPKEREDLRFELELESQIMIDKARKLAKNPLVQFIIGFLAADWFLSRRGK
jgi:hypothetical protein